MSPNPDIFAFLSYAFWAIVAYLVSYLFLGFGLSMLGARVRQRSTWLAWLPIFNFYLMCRLAQVSLLLILPMCIPLLNFLVFAYLGARMAKRVGRSGFLGALFGVPVLGNLTPLLLAVGRPTDEEKAAPPPAQPPLVTALIHTGVVFALLVAPVAIWATARQFSSAPAAAPTVQQAAATLPARVASTMTEFPIDSATTIVATASDLSTRTFTKPKADDKTNTVGLNQDQLPPWIKATSITTLAESATSASYNSAATVAPVKVVNLALRPESAGDLTAPTAAELAAIDPAATAKGVEVKSPDNVVYRGFKVNTPAAIYYALRRGDSNSLVLISASDTAGVPVAERLAANLGNGAGLMADELGRSAVAKLPSAPPGTKLVRVETATTAQLDAIMARLNDAKLMAQFEAEHQDPIGQKLLPVLFPFIKAVMPRSYTVAMFGKDEKSEEAFGGCVAGFSTGSDAWTAVQAARAFGNFIATFGVPIEVHGTEIGGLSGLAIYAEQNGESFSLIVLRDGTFLRGFLGIKKGIIKPEDLRPWAESTVKRK